MFRDNDILEKRINPRKMFNEEREDINVEITDNEDAKIKKSIKKDQVVQPIVFVSPESSMINRQPYTDSMFLFANSNVDVAFDHKHLKALSNDDIAGLNANNMSIAFNLICNAIKSQGYISCINHFHFMRDNLGPIGKIIENLDVKERFQDSYLNNHNIEKFIFSFTMYPTVHSTMERFKANSIFIAKQLAQATIVIYTNAINHSVDDLAFQIHVNPRIKELYDIAIKENRALAKTYDTEDFGHFQFSFATFLKNMLCIELESLAKNLEFGFIELLRGIAQSAYDVYDVYLNNTRIINSDHGNTDNE